MSKIFRDFGIVSVGAVASSIILPSVANALNPTIIYIADIEDYHPTNQKIREAVGSFNDNEIYGIRTNEMDAFYDAKEVTVYFKITGSQFNSPECDEFENVIYINFFNKEEVDRAKSVEEANPYMIYNVDKRTSNEPNNFVDLEKIVDVILRNRRGCVNFETNLSLDDTFNFPLTEY